MTGHRLPVCDRCHYAVPMRRVGALLACTVLAGAAAAPALSAATLTKRFSESANKTLVRITKGTIVVVTLHSTYWTINGANGNEMVEIGQPKYTPAPVGTCVPGGGCGTVSARFRAIRVGWPEITAYRLTCGEALACGPTNNSYTLRIHVTSH